ncbi:hypothetical protein VSU19_10855 [Verrucomicrobiales bacterium BCK34]|nr:hypothetical protein [Verrucomicrobiales bacterium BCK34]
MSEAMMPKQMPIIKITSGKHAGECDATKSQKCSNPIGSCLVENSSFSYTFHAMVSPLEQESKIHQLSPYVGKLKSQIAKELILEFSERDQLIFDPFSGSGTIPLEAKLNFRRSFSSDVSPYSRILTLAKLNAPNSVDDGLREMNSLIEISERLPLPDLRSVPAWVRSFFDPQTLKETIRFFDCALKRKAYFQIACMLGILHHQRPGFLSYPSSHLTPYLRDKKFPRSEYPDMYKYRDFRPRLEKKITRALSGASQVNSTPNRPKVSEFRQASIFGVTWPDSINLVLTSPPYMNALDYGRDNRLRLWFITKQIDSKVDKKNITRKPNFTRAMKLIGQNSDERLQPGGCVVLIIGETVSKGRQENTAAIAKEMVLSNTSLKLVDIRDKPIPDLRRSRKNCRAVTNEQVLVFQKK